MSPDALEALVARLARAGIRECAYEAGATVIRLRFQHHS